MDMRRIIKLLEAADAYKKIDRSAFIYLDPIGDKKQFAQCGTCVAFLPGKKRCGLFGPNDEVIADASCGLYVNGKPHDDQPMLNSVTPRDAGYVLGQVRCENCTWYVDKKCELFEKLNRELPDIFDLDVDVAAQGCCNGWQKTLK
jgi:Pyruvate/2-oxoacid:ferredoxin oxidoreductase delta subunit